MGALWIAIALVAAALQTLRNALQSGLTARIGTVGATQVRFLFGLPFALAFLTLATVLTGEPVPRPTGTVFAWALMGGLAQIAATALMLVVMRQNGFGISTAWLKGEPVIVALIGWAALGDRLDGTLLLAVAVAVCGVLILSIRPGARGADYGELRPAAIGLLAGALFGLSAIGFRGGILALPEGSFVMRALTMLALALVIQTSVLLAWMMVADRQSLRASVQAWRPSLIAGLFGAAASAGWFIAFSLATAAHVRTIALTEVIFALLVSRFYFHQSVSWRQLLGIAVLMAGVLVLLLA